MNKTDEIKKARNFCLTLARRVVYLVELNSRDRNASNFLSIAESAISNNATWEEIGEIENDIKKYKAGINSKIPGINTEYIGTRGTVFMIRNIIGIIRMACFNDAIYEPADIMHGAKGLYEVIVRSIHSNAVAAANISSSRNVKDQEEFYERFFDQKKVNSLVRIEMEVIEKLLLSA